MAQEKWNEETDCQAPPEGQIFCTNNCGYFGSPATMDMCSKCYGDLVLLQPKVPITTVVEVTAIHSSVTELPLARTSRTERLVDAEIVGPVLASAQILKIQKSSSELAGCSQEKHSNPNSSRCFSCNKRVGLTGFKCRCGDVFCARHRYFDEHNCTFDYKTAGRDAITKENPLVKADKIRKI